MDEQPGCLESLMRLFFGTALLVLVAVVVVVILV